MSEENRKEEWQAYIKDPRNVCKYGSKCYQKNPEHHKNFKHPPNFSKRKGNRDSPAGKRFKPSPNNDKSPGKREIKRSPTKITNDGDNSTVVQDESSEQVDQTNLVTKNPSTSHEQDAIAIKLPETLSYHNKDDKDLFKELFLVDMPDDFFKFFECLQEEPNFVNMLANVNLELIGPYELVMGNLPVLDEKDLYLIHWRFFYDPPEFQAVLKKKGKSEYHIGYFRDEPTSAPVFVAHSDSTRGCHITPMATNIFGAVYLYLQNEKKSSPFTSTACHKLMEKVKKWAETHKYSLEEYNMKKRLSETVTKAFHGAGLVVPYNKKTELGYRKLVETDANLKKMFAKLAAATSESEKDKILCELQPVITYASIAVDECDFGTGLECGAALFCSGLRELHSAALTTLQAAYSLLHRDAFAKIVEAHLKYRRKGPNMSILSINK